MFAIGDRVIYPMHGGAIVKAIDSHVHNNIANDYYVLEMLFECMTLSVPVAHAENLGLRNIVSEKELESVAEVLKSMPDVREIKSISWNRRFQIYMDWIKSGKITEVARVFKILKILEKNKKISVGERRLLHNTKQILQSELMLVRDIDAQTAEQWIYEFAEIPNK